MLMQQSVTSLLFSIFVGSDIGSLTKNCNGNSIEERELNPLFEWLSSDHYFAGLLVACS